ncbi:neuropeptide B [Opisthocomus hoazin]|uniref:neuropeptide B n=1 Tax=Opisthocomus hoazin TaxID=30419 RepID=UPI003F53C28A
MRAAGGAGPGLGLLLLLCLCRPAEPWYRPPPGPRHYSVGRAAGLLSSPRRPPPARLAGPGTDGSARRGPSLRLPGLAPAPAQPRATAPCVTEVAPAPRSCRRLPGAPAALRCEAAVTLSLDPVECTDA